MASAPAAAARPLPRRGRIRLTAAGALEQGPWRGEGGRGGALEQGPWPRAEIDRGGARGRPGSLPAAVVLPALAAS